MDASVKGRPAGLHSFLMSICWCVLLALPGTPAEAAPPVDWRGVFTGTGVETTRNCNDSRMNYTFRFSVRITVPAQTGEIFTGTGRRVGSFQGVAPLNGLRATQLSEFYRTLAAGGRVITIRRSTMTLAGFTETSAWEVAPERDPTINGNTLTFTETDKESGCTLTMSYTGTRQGAIRLPQSMQYSALGDFNGDGNADLILRNAQTTMVRALALTGSATATSTDVSPQALTVELHGIGDLDGDGRDDLVWRNGATGELGVWLMNGGLSATASLRSLSPTYQLQAVDDYNGDGRDDLLFRHGTSGALLVWLMNGTTISSAALLPVNLPLTQRVVGTGDVNGDGKADVVLRYADRQISALLLDGTTVLGLAVLPIPPAPFNINSAAWQVRGVGDISGDGVVDIVWQNDITRQVGVTLVGGPAAVAGHSIIGNAATGYVIQGIGDANADGRADLVLRGGRAVVVWFMTGATIAGQTRVATEDPMWIID